MSLFMSLQKDRPHHLNCAKCGENKPVSEFYAKSSNFPNLRAGYCKDCCREYQREYRERTSQVKEKRCSYCKAVLPISAFSSAGQSYCKSCRTEYGRKRSKIQWLTDPIYELKQKAWNMAQRLKRKPCENCGTEDKIERHHSDYTKPLQVVCLCRVCHAKIHRRAKTYNSVVVL